MILMGWGAVGFLNPKRLLITAWYLIQGKSGGIQIQGGSRDGRATRRGATGRGHEAEG